jgi:class 3 adenylate cyclase
LYDKLRHLQTAQEAPLSAIKSDENRLVTVMFVDAVDSTQIARRLEGEGRTDDWKAIIGQAHKRLADVVEQWDGEVGQYLGDGLLSFFGASRSQGDEAERAVSCALAIQEDMGRYGWEIAVFYPDLQIDFAVRIGISTGRVVVGSIGTEKKHEVLAVGPATNLAARLQGLALPGSVLIDAETYYRVHEHFITEALPAAEIKGFDTRVEAYAVLKRHQAAQFMSNALAGIEVPFARPNSTRSNRFSIEPSQPETWKSSRFTARLALERVVCCKRYCHASSKSRTGR